MIKDLHFTGSRENTVVNCEHLFDYSSTSVFQLWWSRIPMYGGQLCYKAYAVQVCFKDNQI